MVIITTTSAMIFFPSEIGSGHGITSESDDFGGPVRVIRNV